MEAGNLPFQQTVLRWVGALVSVFMELMFGMCLTIQIVKFLRSREDTSSLLSGVNRRGFKEEVCSHPLLTGEVESAQAESQSMGC